MICIVSPKYYKTWMYLKSWAWASLGHPGIVPRPKIHQQEEKKKNRARDSEQNIGGNVTRVI